MTRSDRRTPAGARGHGPRGKRKPASAGPRERVLGVVARLPEATAVPHGAHLGLEVRKKRFGWFLDDHHGDGRVALDCKAAADVRDLMRQLVPQQLHVPKYLGSKGWIGLWLDVPDVDWSAVELALREAYCLVAPRTLRQGIK